MSKTSVSIIVVLLTVLFACGKVGALDCDSKEVKSRVLAEYATNLKDNFAKNTIHAIEGNITAGDTALKVFDVTGYDNLKATANKNDLVGTQKMTQKWIKEKMDALEASISSLTLTNIVTTSKDDGKKKCDCEGRVKGEGLNDTIVQYSVQETSGGLRVDLIK